jgi:hypothetical protein
MLMARIDIFTQTPVAFALVRKPNGGELRFGVP